MGISELKYYKAFNANLSAGGRTSLMLLEEGEGWKRPTVLFKAEIEQLRWVATTKKEARTILQRNSLLMDNVDDSNNSSSRIGCPHCKHESTRGFSCDDCAWRAAQGPDFSFPCLNQTFSGVRLRESGIFYSASSEFYSGIDLGDSKVKAQTSIRFLAGHVEWAIMLLEGDIPLVETSYRDWTESARKRWCSKASAAIWKERSEASWAAIWKEKTGDEDRTAVTL